MRFGSVCSGIEAASVAWHPLGWRAAFLSEIDAFPSAVLAHHHPDVPNLGDMTKFKEWPDAAIDVLVGGTPCQSFSVAGLRKGLADPRGNLMLTYLAIADRYRPRWLVWENVPGVLSSNKGRDFGALLGGLAELGYGFAYRVLDAQYFGLAQRRRRVFVVGCLGDWRRAAAVLFERASLRGDHPPSRKSREGVAPTIGARTKGGGGLGTDFDRDGGPIPERARALTTSNQRIDASEDGTGRGTPLVPVAFDTTQITHPANHSNPKPGDPCHPLASAAHAPAIAFTAKDHGGDATEDCSPTLRAGGHSGSHANAGVMPAIAFNWANGGGYGEAHDGLGISEEHAPPHSTSQVAAVAFMDTESHSSGNNDDLSPTMRTGDCAKISAAIGMQVRRLTPRECERLQGFPDDYTLISYRNKPSADGPRYKALGNSMAVPVMRWIGERIALVDAIRAAA